jgi:hypothetical protein
MKTISQIVAFFIWAVVGLILWVPLLVRAFLIQVTVYLFAALEKSPPAYLDDANRKIMRFWTDGFAYIDGSLPKPKKGADAEESEDGIWLTWVADMATVAIFYGALYLSFAQGGLSALFNDEKHSYLREWPLEYRDALLTNDIKITCISCESGSVYNAQFQILRVDSSNGMGASPRPVLRICNSASSPTYIDEDVDLYYTDSRNVTVSWLKVPGADIKPGACSNIKFETTGQDQPYLQADYLSGNYYVQYGRNRLTIPIP